MMNQFWKALTINLASLALLGSSTVLAADSIETTEIKNLGNKSTESLLLSASQATLSGQWTEKNGENIVIIQQNNEVLAHWTDANVSWVYASGTINGDQIAMKFNNATITGTISSTKDTITWSNGGLWSRTN